MKNCIKCHESSTLVEFPKKGNICKKCVKEYKRKYPISFFSFDNEYNLSDAIQKEYKFLAFGSYSSYKLG